MHSVENYTRLANRILRYKKFLVMSAPDWLITKEQFLIKKAAKKIGLVDTGILRAHLKEAVIRDLLLQDDF